MSVPLQTMYALAVEAPFRKSSLRFRGSDDAGTKVLHEFWYRIAALYGWAELTYSSDRPIPIAGLARTFSNLLRLPPNDYLCGIWRPRLAHDLMWARFQHRAREESLPFWTWLSACGNLHVWPVLCLGSDIYTPDFLTLAIEGAFTNPIVDPFRAISWGEINLKAPLCEITIEYNPSMNELTT